MSPQVHPARTCLPARRSLAGSRSQVVAFQHTYPIMFTTTTLFVLAPVLITYLAMAALTSGEPDTANELLIRALATPPAVRGDRGGIQRARASHRPR